METIKTKPLDFDPDILEIPDITDSLHRAKVKSVYDEATDDIDNESENDLEGTGADGYLKKCGYLIMLFGTAFLAYRRGYRKGFENGALKGIFDGVVIRCVKS